MASADDVDQHFELHPTLDAGREVEAPAPTSSSTSAIPMSMPSILRNTSVPQYNRIANASSLPPMFRIAKPSNARSANKDLGRRKQRRSDNAAILSTNPHAVRPSAKDFRLQSNTIKSTFPEYTSASKANHKLLTNLPPPSHGHVGSTRPVSDPVSSNHGHFGSSLKDARKVLKKLEVSHISECQTDSQAAGDLERFVWTVDRQIRLWSTEDVYVLPGAAAKQDSRKKGRVLLNAHFQPPNHEGSAAEQQDFIFESVQDVSRETGRLIEIQRSPNALVWLIQDPFLRLVVHCLARVYGCPSFSKDDLSRPGLRFTWILNKNPLTRRRGGRKTRRASISSSVLSHPSDASQFNAVGTRGHARLPVNARLGGLRQSVLDTPPTTDADSQTESEIDIATTDFESEIGTESEEVAESLAASLVLPAQSSRSDHSAELDHNTNSEDGLADVEQEIARQDAEDIDVATDEEEADILRRVRKWALDNHRQRVLDAQKSSIPSSHRLRNVTIASPLAEQEASDSTRPAHPDSLAILEVSEEQEADSDAQ